MCDNVIDGLGFKTQWTVLDDNNEVMSRLLLRNNLHLHQTWETPCTKGLIKIYIGEYGLGIGSKDILKGNFNPNLAVNFLALNQWLKIHI
eukprot:8992660-Ditylum_brightwellii.AAC.1